VGTTEADISKNRISNESPLGKALIGNKVGDEVTVKAPQCDYVIKILSIKE
jgi:transcription elongation factor GreA